MIEWTQIRLIGLMSKSIFYVLSANNLFQDVFYVFVLDINSLSLTISTIPLIIYRISDISKHSYFLSEITL